ncbi:hypothetical protein [Agrobacterium sp. B1(2019)]|uniref:hypothetical protein n=1 Tax=Agrobacterium sp. B1(2019) TaxID=2607032 RepID=UPI0011ECECEF|nr:hypothetical protein [Agrobacterium sp. B1(2019)]TZG36207.1 hypothetical protein AGR1_01385 [Agrobacterium sp. B1(2019)]
MSDERNEVTEDYPAAVEACRAELHKMAEQAADSALTDIYEMVGEREERARAANVVVFPHLNARQPGRTPSFIEGAPGKCGRNVLPFRRKGR